MKTAPAVEAGVESRIWKIEDVVEMMDEQAEKAEKAEKAETAKFEAAFASQSPKTHEPAAPLVPWYLDAESGVPNLDVKKPGIAYETDDNCPF